MIVEADGRRAAVVLPDDAARYGGSRWEQRTRPANPATPAMSTTRFMIEIRLRQGGISPRALLGGQFEPDQHGTQLQVAVLIADEPLGFGREALCPSQLGKPLVTGLPDEFAPAVADQLAADTALPAGLLRIDHAAHAEANSSPAAFAKAARLLTAVITTSLHNHDALDAAKQELAT